MPIVSRSKFGGWDESTIKLLLKSINISAIVQHMSVSFVSLRSSRVYFQNNAFILRKVVGNLCDMAFLQNRRFERSLFTLCDPAPLRMSVLESTDNLSSPYSISSLIVH